MKTLRVSLLCLFLLQTALAWALKPSREWAATPDSVGLAYQSLTLATPDHAQLATWVIEPTTAAPDQHTTLVLAYGDAGNMGNWVHQARALASAGYRVYLFDYRGFGHSSDFVINLNRLYYHEFALDLNTVLADAKRRYPRNRTGILGFSMGTIMSAEVAAAHRCDFFIAEGYVGNPQAIVANVLKNKHKQLSLPAEAARYARLAPRINCPWLLIAGTQDVNTPLADSAAVVQAARRGQRRELISFAGEHSAGFYTLSDKEFGDLYVAAIRRFLAVGGKG
ncbi:alpha/beta fold hydrolase [Hymenobacter sp. H14-R3]|uniref:alpha/beta hydrolase family protein n=1 Tax=Hymenobacter sp. H14-R3 TaxID=3046308 RepID=UPI0024BB53A0|nr:alpha/beta fold hydrolase [Hymenobacter sp. H14-R3]MDJ0363894.1 alpha/beta fold hydrolase [Hymenobacter sp. H14-R3]